MNGEYEHVRYALLLAPRQCIVERSDRLGEKNIFSILFCGYFLKLFFVAWIHIIKTEIKTIKVRPQCGNVFIFSGGVVQWNIIQVWQVPQKNIFQAQLDHRFQYFAQRGNSLAISETLVLLTTSPKQALPPPGLTDCTPAAAPHLPIMAFPAALLWPPTPHRHPRPTAIGFTSIDVISSFILRICRPTLKDPIHDACAILMYDLDLWQRSELIVVILHFDKPQVSVQLSHISHQAMPNYRKRRQNRG